MSPSDAMAMPMTSQAATLMEAVVAPRTLGLLTVAPATIARLDQAFASHPLAQAFLYRARLDAVCRQATVDGDLIDPLHLAATLEGLRLRMDPFLTMMDREDIFDRARTALTLYQWIVEPDFDQEGEV